MDRGSKESKKSKDDPLLTERTESRGESFQSFRLLMSSPLYDLTSTSCRIVPPSADWSHAD